MAKDERTGPGDEIGQNSNTEIGNAQNDDQTGEEKPFYGGLSDAEVEIAGHKQKAGQQLDEWIHRRNRKMAGAAFAAQP
jgi:hypothetical protein